MLATHPSTDASLDDIINGACDECGVKPNVSKLQESLLRIVKFVSEKSIEIYNAGKKTRRLAAEKERAEAVEARAEAEKERAEAQKEKFRKNAKLIQKNSFAKNVEDFLDGLSKVLPSNQPKSREHIKTIGKTY